ncbi:acetyl-CoA carboxylase biotin carboxyl carrier protein [Candidatus Bipolaricaulota bacterium]|nr:acetyl-CoA carboxylase biotin carboxyl carrier protein [Candidatus Bipolaricaulota bacterium]
MDLEELRKLCALLREEGLTELTVEEEGRRITIRRAPVPGVPPPSQGEAGEAEGEVELVRSPVVGTFWRRPAPGEDPFVEVGDRVQPGQVLCIVEAMKVMNEVRADRAGLIEEVLVEDGQPVEYGQPLFRLRPQ